MIETDPFAALELFARRQQAEDTAAKAISKARVQLVLDKQAKSVFFATLALRMRPVVSWEEETAATDGRRLIYNPEFVNSLTAEERIGLLAHEVMHNAMGHPVRRGELEPARFNIACDLAINCLLREAGYTLPPHGLFPGEGPYAAMPVGLSAEEYYSQLPASPPPNGPGGQADDDPGRCGGVIDAGDEAAKQQTRADWQVAVAQAKQASEQRGNLPGGLARAITAIVEPTVPWQDVLREFLARSLSARDDYSWSVPNRRYIAQDMYLPSLRSESMGEVVVAIDTSGSVGERELNAFGAELNGILGCNPCRQRR